MLKRGVSPVIATVLLVILTLVAVSILAVFVVRFVNDSVKDGDACFQVLGDLSLEESTGYNCYTSNGAVKRTGFSVRVDSEDIVGFKAILTSQGSANPFQIENASTFLEIRMLDSNFNTPLNVPVRGGTRTYVVNGTFERVEINALLKSGKVCDTREKLDLSACKDQNKISGLLLY